MLIWYLLTFYTNIVLLEKFFKEKKNLLKVKIDHKQLRLPPFLQFTNEEYLCMSVCVCLSVYMSGIKAVLM